MRGITEVKRRRELARKAGLAISNSTDVKKQIGWHLQEVSGESWVEAKLQWSEQCGQRGHRDSIFGKGKTKRASHTSILQMKWAERLLWNKGTPFITGFRKNQEIWRHLVMRETENH